MFEGTKRDGYTVGMVAALVLMVLAGVCAVAGFMQGKPVAAVAGTVGVLIWAWLAGTYNNYRTGRRKR